MEQENEKKLERNKKEEKIIEGGVNNIDYEDNEELYQEQILKNSCNPMYLTRITPNKKQNKIAEHKIKDVISKNEKKASHFIQKKNQSLEQRGFAEGETANKLCSFGITAFGMSQSLIDCIEKNQKLIDAVEQNDFVVDKELYIQLKNFREELLNSTDSGKVKKLIGYKCS